MIILLVIIQSFHIQETSKIETNPIPKRLFLESSFDISSVTNPQFVNCESHFVKHTFAPERQQKCGPVLKYFLIKSDFSH